MLADWHISSGQGREREREIIYLEKKNRRPDGDVTRMMGIRLGYYSSRGPFFQIGEFSRIFCVLILKTHAMYFYIAHVFLNTKIRCEQEHTVTTSITFIGYNLSYSIGLNILGLSLPCPIGSPKWLSWGTSVWAASHSGRRTNSEFWVPEMMNLFCSTRGLGIPRSELHWNG